MEVEFNKEPGKTDMKMFLGFVAGGLVFMIGTFTGYSIYAEVTKNILGDPNDT